MVEDLLKQGKRVCTLGPIIHNPQTLARLQSLGAVIVKEPEEAPPGSLLNVRMQPVRLLPKFIALLRKKGIKVIWS